MKSKETESQSDDQWASAERVTCARCGQAGLIVRDILPYGTTKANSVVLHPGCWHAWMKEHGKL